MFFVDTSALSALLLPEDRNHDFALGWLEKNRDEKFITTDYILDELYTVLLVRSKNKRWTIDTIYSFKNTDWIEKIVFVTQEDYYQAEQVFLNYVDKEWSFTDCICKVVMERLNINQIFAFDDHFNQFGTLSVFPN